jgi:3-hydroxy-3-methylglutaryl CoA synthase/uncharacterized OB-fold protein
MTEKALLETGITSIAAYLPRRRLARKAIVAANQWANPGLAKLGAGHRTICSHDEDSLTMAVEACRNCLVDAGGFRPQLVQFASTTPPFADRANSVMLTEALTLPVETQCMDAAGYLGSGAGALVHALNGDRPALTTASDKRVARIASPQELSFGHAAAAVATGTEHLIARFVAAHCLAVDFVDHYRSTGTASDYVLEERWIRDEGQMKVAPPAIRALLDKAECKIGDIRHVAISGVPRATLAAIAKTCGIVGAQLVDPLDQECGNTGSAHALLMLCHALESAGPGEKILLLNVAQGAQGLLFETTDAIAGWKPASTVRAQLASGFEDDNYLRFLSFCGEIDVDWGIRAERDNRTALSAFNRHRRTITSFVGGICSACGTRQFPKGQCCVNPQCRRFDTLVDEPFQHKIGKVRSFTEDWLAVSANPPMMYGNVGFEDGGVVMMELADFEPGQLAVGTPVRFVFRIKDRDPKRHFHRYFWKAAPTNMAEAD